MVGSRTLTAVVGIVVSLAVSVAVWYYFNTVLLFLFVPFVPFLLRRGETREQSLTRECPSCGFTTRNPAYDYCPHDGSELTVQMDETGPR